MSGVETKQVDRDEAGMRLDHWFKLHYPGLGFGRLQKLLRSGQVRVDGGRVKTSSRLAAGQSVRVPPVQPGDTRPQTRATIRDRSDADVLGAALLHEDEAVYVFNKPAGLAVQGGSGVNRHVDGMLEAWRDRRGQKPRLVHRLDRDTAGVLVVARTRGAAAFLGKAFKSRQTRKTYWALCRGVPSPSSGRVSTFLAKREGAEGDRMHVARQGEEGAQHAVSTYAVVEASGRKLSWVAWRPITGRTHQLRAHAAHVGHPIIGDPKYFDVENWELPGGIQNRLHLLARRIAVPHPDGGTLDVSAPLPPHMLQSWNLLAFDEGEASAAEARL